MQQLLEMARTACMRIVGSVAVGALAIGMAHGADTYPNRQVRVIVPYSTGGGTDVLTRELAQRLSESTGQAFFIDNKPGGDATIGVNIAAHAPADGYTLLAVSGVPFLINQFAFKELPYDTAKDFVPVATFASLPMVLVSAPGVPAGTAKDFVSYAKANPGKINYAGTDQMTFLGTEMIAQGTGTRMVHVPYKGAGPALNDLLGSHVDVMLSSVSPALPYIKDGKIKALAVTTKNRSPALPNVPTVSESIYPDFELTAWFGIYAPAGTPPAIVEQLAREVGAAMKSAPMTRRLESMGADAYFLPSAEFKRFIDAENVRWSKAFKDTGQPVR